MRSNSGFTLLEMVIAMTIFGLVLTGITESMVSARMLGDNIAVRTELTRSNGSVLNTLAQDLRGADHNYIYHTSGDYWSFKVCTGFDNDGMPIYDQGLFGRYLRFDPTSGKIYRTLIDSNGSKTETVLAQNVKDFSIEPREGSLLQGSVMTITLTTSESDAAGNIWDRTASRKIFLRSTQYNTDGLNGAQTNQTTNNTSGSTTGSTDTTSDTSSNTSGDTSGNTSGDVTQPEQPVVNFSAPTFAWSGDEDKAAKKVRITITINTDAYSSLDPKSVVVSWDTSDTGNTIKATTVGNQVTVVGDCKSALTITIHASAVAGSASKTSASSNTF